MGGTIRPFFGRARELQALRELLKKRTASLVVCRGRRRIGKSRVIQEFGADADVFWQFQGLSPRKGLTPADQLASFSEQLSRQS